LKFLPPEKPLAPESPRLSDRIRVKAHDMLERIDDDYEKRLRWTLAHRRPVVITIVVVSVLSFGLIKFIGTEFFPDQDEGQFSLTIKLPVGTRSEETDKFVQRVEQVLLANIPELETMISDVGVPSAQSGNVFSRNSGSHSANIQVALVPIEKRKRDVF